MDYNKITIDENLSIIDALSKLNSFPDNFISRLILFVLSNNKVVGSLTDGDIRRSLLKGYDLNDSVSGICNRKFVFKYETSDYIEFNSLRKKNLKIIPLLNRDKSLSRIIDLNITKSLLPVECVINAGGKGKRLSPHTNSIPKPMLPLNGKPILEYIIDKLIEFGIKKIYISVRYLSEQIIEYFGNGSSKGIDIEYIKESKPLGTAGGLSLINHFKSENILLMNADALAELDFEAMYLNLIKSKADMIIASKEYKVDIPYGIFETKNNKVNKFKEKPSFLYRSNAGIYMFNKKLISKIPHNEFYHITHLIKLLLDNNNNILHYPMIGYWIDIGTPQDYKIAQEVIKYFK